MNPIFLVGGIAVAYFMIQSSSKKPKNLIYTPTDKVLDFPGYKVEKCNKIIIIDKDKALKNSYSQGKLSYNPLDFNKLLGGNNCVSLLSKLNDVNQVEFMFILMMHFYAGMLAEGRISLDALRIASDPVLEATKKRYPNIDFSKWPNYKTVYSIIDSYDDSVKEFPGYYIINCKDIFVENEEKAFIALFSAGYKNESISTFLGGDDCGKDLTTYDLLHKDIAGSLFVYKLMLSYLAGKVYKGLITMVDAAKLVQEYKQIFISKNVVVKDWPDEKAIPNLIATYKDK